MDAKKGRVLCVDDEPNILMALEFLFKRSGYEVRLARDGGEALREADACGSRSTSRTRRPASASAPPAVPPTRRCASPAATAPTGTAIRGSRRARTANAPQPTASTPATL